MVSVYALSDKDDAADTDKGSDSNGNYQNANEFIDCVLESILEQLSLVCNLLWSLTGDGSV